MAIVSQYEHITLMMYLVLLEVRTRLSMVEAKDDEAVTYVISESGFGSLLIVKGVDHVIYINDTNMEEEHQKNYFLTYKLL